jgi:hypothetical protein
MAKKTLCDWKPKARLKKLARYSRLVENPRYLCESCGRVAGKKKYLCQPHKLYQQPDAS